MKIGGFTEQELADFWTPGKAKAVLIGAWKAVLACPLSKGDYPAGVQCAWPDVLREQMDYPIENVVRPIRPGQQELTEALRAFHWVMFIDAGRDRKVVVARLCGAKWDKIQRLDGRSREYLARRIQPKAYAEIARHLNTEKKVIPRGFTKVTKFGR